MKQIEEEAKAGAPEWVVTFGDMMSLLLTFFVLLLSFSSLEIVKFKKMAGYMREAFGLRPEIRVSDGQMGATILPEAAASQKARTRSVLQVQLARSMLEQSGMADKGEVQVTDRGVAIRLDGDTAFSSASAELTVEAYRLLDKIAELAAGQPGTIEIEGHTDDVPITTPRYPSNWELSSARAATATRYLVAKGIPADRIKAVGYADSKPLAPNDSAGNRAKNRRIEFLFVSTEKIDRQALREAGLSEKEEGP